MVFFRELEELEAIKEAEEAALAEAEAAAAEAADALNGLLCGDDGPDLDDPGGNNNPSDDGGVYKGPEGDGSDSPDDGGVYKGSSHHLIDVTGGSRGSLLSGNAGQGNGSAPSKYAVVAKHDHSQSVDGGIDGISISSAPYRSDVSLDCPPHPHHNVAGGHRGSSTGLGGGGSRLSSLPASPFVRRASKSNSFSSHVRLHEKYGNSKKPLVLFTYLDAQEHLPYADDSTAVTPKSELNGGIVVDTPTRMGLSRKLSYNSHCGKVDSYNSHTDLRYPPNAYNNGNGGATATPGNSCHTKEGILTKRMASLFSDKPTTPNSILLDPITDLQQRKCSSGFVNNAKESVDLQVGHNMSISWCS